MRDIDRNTITQAVKDTFATEPGSRFEELLHGLIDHLHDFARTHRVTHDEWMAALSFLYDSGRISTPERHEFILLSDVLGVSALVDMINTKEGATEGSNLGPFYLDDAPRKPLGADLSGGRDGVCVLVRGTVTDDRATPLPGAVVDTWQADGAGEYPVTQEGQDRMDLRGIFETDAEGRYWYTTILPRPYTVPYDGPVGALLRAGNRHAWRPAHLHFIVRAPGMSSITTEVFFEGAEYLDDDAVFGVRRSLIAAPRPVAAGEDLGLDLTCTPEAVIDFDFVLTPEG